MNFDWKALVGALAPTIATAFGGPLAGLGVKAVIGALGLGDGAGEAEIAATLASATPDQLLALKKADQEFAVRLKQLGIDLEKVNAEDRSSARNMQVQTRSWVPGVLAIVITIGFFGVLSFILGFGLKKEMAGAEALLVMLGALGTAWGAVVNFFYGSSSGSVGKDETIKMLSR